MKKLISLIIILFFAFQSAETSYALRPVASKLSSINNVIFKSEKTSSAREANIAVLANEPAPAIAIDRIQNIIEGKGFVTGDHPYVPHLHLVSFLFSQMLVQINLQGLDVLDMATGQGNQALIETIKGANVVAVDKYPEAIMCVEENKRIFLQQKERSRLTAFTSDLFNNIPQGRKFDYITCVPPMLSGAINGREDVVVYDLGFKFIKDFLLQAKTYLKSNGKILLIYPSHDDPDYLGPELDGGRSFLEGLAQENGYSIQIAAEGMGRFGIFVLRDQESARPSDVPKSSSAGDTLRRAGIRLEKEGLCRHAIASAA